jgi:hypothetical protein
MVAPFPWNVRNPVGCETALSENANDDLPKQARNFAFLDSAAYQLRVYHKMVRLH